MKFFRHPYSVGHWFCREQNIPLLGWQSLRIDFVSHTWCVLSTTRSPIESLLPPLLAGFMSCVLPLLMPQYWSPVFCQSFMHKQLSCRQKYICTSHRATYNVKRDVNTWIYCCWSMIACAAGDVASKSPGEHFIHEWLLTISARVWLLCLRLVASP